MHVNKSPQPQSHCLDSSSQEKNCLQIKEAVKKLQYLGIDYTFSSCTVSFAHYHTNDSRRGL